MPATAEDRTSDSIEALGSGQLNQFRIWDLFFSTVCCTGPGDIEKFSMGTFMGKTQNELSPHSCTVDSFLIILILKMREQGRNSLWLSCFKMVIIENKIRSRMNKGRVLKRENKFVAAYGQHLPWQYVLYQVLSLLAQSKCPTWVDTKVLYTTMRQKLLKRKCVF